MKKGLRRAGIVGLSTVVAGSMMTGLAVATPTFAFDRIQGADRYATAVAVATQYGAATNVILANGTSEHTVDALTASYLAGVKKAPILLTRLDATPANVMARLAAGGTTDVWIVGGTGAISAAQETALDVLYTVHRLGGADRYATGEKVIEAAVPSASTTALLATGTNFPDALGAGPLSYVKGMPVAITRPTALPSSTLAALKAAGVTNVIALGGPTIVSQGVLDTLAANGITLNQRIFGADRSETSTKLADYEITNQGFTNAAVNVASGEDTPAGADALGGSALSGKELRPTIITRSITSVGNGMVAFMTAHANTLASGHIFGGLGAVSQAVEDALTAAAKTVVSNQSFTVTPADTAVVPFGTASATTTRTYSVAVPAGTVVDIQLFEASNVTVAANGSTTFADALAPANEADVGTLNGAIISLVNGVANSSATAADITSTGTVTFTVSSPTGAVDVRPVVFAGAGNNVLDLVVPTTPNTNPKQPSEAFGVGGTTIFTSAEAPLGTSTITVATADTTNNFYANGATYYYDANDGFQYSGIVISMAQFESILSAGDSVTAVYNPDPTGVSTFNLTSDSVGTFGAAPSVTVSNQDGGATANDVQATFTPPTNASSGTTYQLIDGATVVTGTTQAAGSTAGTLVITALNVANGVHTYKIRANNPVSGATTDSPAAAPATVPALADTTGPGSTFLGQTNGGGLAGTLDSGDTIKVVFNEPMAAPTAGDKIRFTDGDGTIVDATCGTNATCTRNAAAEVVNSVSRPANTVLTYVLTADPTIITAGTTAGEAIASGTATDQAGNTDLAGNAWDLGGISTDKTLN